MAIDLRNFSSIIQNLIHRADLDTNLHKHIQELKMKIQRNSLCVCGSGKKYKKCCLALESKPIRMISGIHEVCDKILVQMESGDLLGAVEKAERLYNLYPDDHMVNYLQGVCHIQKEQYQKAISFFEKTVLLNQWFCEAYFNLANLYRREMNIPNSIACFKKIIEIEGVHGDLGKIANEEIDSYEKFIQKSSGKTLEEYLHEHSLFDEAFTFLKREKYQEAISLFKQMLILNPNHVQSHGNIALAYSALGEQNIALQHLDKALLLDPSYEPAQQNRENVIMLKEGEKSPIIMQEVSYYKEKLESKGKRESKPTALSWSSSAQDYIPLYN